MDVSDSRSRRERRAGVTAVTGTPTEEETRRMKTRAVARRSTLHLARKDAPSRGKTQQVFVAKRLHRPDKTQNALEHLLVCRLRKLRNSPKSCRQNPGRPCPRLKWLSPSLLGNYCARPLSFCMTRSLVDSLSCFNRVNSEICSAASGTSLYQDDDDEEMEDAVTSNAGITLVILSLLYQPF